MFPRLLTLWVTAVLAAGCYECNLDNCKDGCCSAQGVCIVAPTSDLESGGSVAVVGLVGIIASATSRCIRRQGSSTGICLQKEVPDLTIPSAIVAGLGVGVIITAVLLPGEPVSAEEVLPAIDTYNASLVKKPAVSLHLAPSIGPDGAGMTVVGSF